MQGGNNEQSILAMLGECRVHREEGPLLLAPQDLVGEPLHSSLLSLVSYGSI